MEAAVVDGISNVTCCRQFVGISSSRRGYFTVSYCQWSSICCHFIGGAASYVIHSWGNGNTVTSSYLGSGCFELVYINRIGTSRTRSNIGNLVVAVVQATIGQAYLVRRVRRDRRSNSDATVVHLGGARLHAATVTQVNVLGQLDIERVGRSICHYTDVVFGQGAGCAAFHVQGRAQLALNIGTAVARKGQGLDDFSIQVAQRSAHIIGWGRCTISFGDGVTGRFEGAISINACATTQGISRAFELAHVYCIRISSTFGNIGNLITTYI